MAAPLPTRRYMRRALKAEFRLCDTADTSAGEILFDSVDISEGGAFLRADLLLERGDRVWVEFTLPEHNTPISVQARVVWVTHQERLKGEAGMALEFVDLKPSEREAIAAFVHSYSQAALHKP